MLYESDVVGRRVLDIAVMTGGQVKYRIFVKRIEIVLHIFEVAAGGISFGAVDDAEFSQ